MDPERKVAQWLEIKGGSRMETTVHVVDCGAFRRQKRFGGNRQRGASGVGSYINKVDLFDDYFIGAGRMKRTCMLVNL